MARISINGLEYTAQDGLTIIQVCDLLGIEIPRFCYHERLAISGNCRMCLVQLEKVNKPVASCTQNISDGMIIHTNSEMVRKAREGVMEFLLINHPLDCPICDQAGECDLQDQAIKYGRGYSRYTDEKRAVQDKDIGPLIKTHMTRCIHCTRCVRFLDDVAGTRELGTFGRGESMEIAAIDNVIKSELSGNIIDLCPVGALTSKPYEFKARPWELKRMPSIDVLDAVGSNILIDAKNNKVVRILPNRNDEINEEWISDKTRFAYDGLHYQRLAKPMIRIDSKLQYCSWEQAYSLVASKVDNTRKKTGAIAGNLTDLETMFLMKLLLQELGSSMYDCREDESILNGKTPYIFQSTIAGIERATDCLIIGSNPRNEAAVLNSRIRKATMHYGLEVALIGQQFDLHYDYQHVNISLKQLASSKHSYSKKLYKSHRPIIILGAGALNQASTLRYTLEIAAKCNPEADWKVFNILQHAASRVGGFDIGFIPDQGLETMNVRKIVKESDLLFLLGTENKNILEGLQNSTTMVYIGHHFNQIAQMADVILPGAAYTEKSATYVNLEGRMQRTNKIVPPPGEAQADYLIVLEIMQKCLAGYVNTLDNIRLQMGQLYPALKQVGTIGERQFEENPALYSAENITEEFTYPIPNFYMSDPISCNSATMAKCSKKFT